MFACFFLVKHFILYMLWFKFSFGAKKLVQFLFSFVMYSLT